MRPCFPGPMNVIAMGFDVLINIWMHRFGRSFPVESGFQGPDGEVFAALPFQARALNHMPEVGNDAHLSPELAILIEVDAPGIAAALRKDFKCMCNGMEAP